MDLEKLYRRVEASVASLDTRGIWPGFRPLKFALYDSEKCFFDGRFVEKTPAFCANTSIVYNGEQIAIWMVTEEPEEPELPVLTSKLVHEMFHGYQTVEGWSCWPNETEALFRYGYDADGLCIRLRENELLLALLEGFDAAAYAELRSLRRLRSERFPYQFSYESMVEEIEGTANYVEWQALKRLDPAAADALTERMRAALTAPERLFPIRISCYFTGALMINALLAAGDYSFTPEKRPAPLGVIASAAKTDGRFPGRDALRERAADAIAAFDAETDAIVASALERNEVVLEGPLELAFVNIYNARCRNGYLTSAFFLMYRENGEDRMLPGDFVIRMKDERTIDRVYRMARTGSAG